LLGLEPGIALREGVSRVCEVQRRILASPPLDIQSDPATGTSVLT